MKKLIAIFVLAASLLSPESCANLFAPPDTPEVEPPDTGYTFEDFEAAIDDNQPTKATVKVTDTTALGIDLSSTFEITYKANGDATIKYSIERLLPITEGYDPDKIKETRTGTVTYTASSKSYSDGGALVGSNIAPKAAALTLDEDLMRYTITGNTLNATVYSENTADIIGASVSDLTLALTIANGQVSTVVMSYDLVKISCSYIY
jgi:hypothetical protein